MHDLAFADAARPTQVRCLRLVLRDYSLGHELLLLRSRNPLLCLPEAEFNELSLAEQIFAIRSAVAVCHQSWSDSQKPQRGIYLWSWLTRHADYASEIAEFRNYLNAAHQFLPRPSQTAVEASLGRQQKGRNLGAPFLAQLVNFIAPRVRQFDVGVVSVWDFPFAIAHHLYFSQLESDGGMYIENQDECDTRTKEDQIMTEFRAEQSGRIARGEIDEATGFEIDKETGELIDPATSARIPRFNQEQSTP